MLWFAKKKENLLKTKKNIINFNKVNHNVKCQNVLALFQRFLKILNIFFSLIDFTILHIYVLFLSKISDFKEDIEIFQRNKKIY